MMRANAEVCFQVDHHMSLSEWQSVIALVVQENVGSWRVAEKAGMRFEGLATYYDMPDLKKYVAERAWWTPPQQASS